LKLSRARSLLDRGMGTRNGAVLVQGAKDKDDDDDEDEDSEDDVDKAADDGDANDDKEDEMEEAEEEEEEEEEMTVRGRNEPAPASSAREQLASPVRVDSISALCFVSVTGLLGV